MTVGIVVVSHSSKIAEGAVELAAQMAPDVELVAAGGTDDERIGTSLEKVLAAVEQSLIDAGGDGVVKMGAAAPAGLSKASQRLSNLSQALKTLTFLRNSNL